MQHRHCSHSVRRFVEIPPISPSPNVPIEPGADSMFRMERIESISEAESVNGAAPGKQRRQRSRMDMIRQMKERDRGSQSSTRNDVTTVANGGGMIVDETQMIERIA